MKQCVLCERDFERLIESHLLPNAAYRAMKNTDDSKKIVRIDLRNETLYFNDRQTKAYLLCNECEDLFSRKGERPIGMLWANDKGFKLLELLNNSPNFEQLENGRKLYSPEVLPKHIVESIFYFSCSIFWRASVWPERLDSGYNGALGPYTKKLREYLLNDTPIEPARLMILVNTAEKFHSLMQIPKLVCKNGVKTHYASIQGLQFMMYFGGSTKSVDNENIFKDIVGDVVFVTLDISSTSIITNIAEKLGPNMRKVGKLQTYPES